MKNERKISILQLLEEYYNTPEGEETKFSWDYLHQEAPKLLTEINELTPEAKAEADRNSFDDKAYKQILICLKNNNYQRLETQISGAYKRGKFDLDQLLKDRNINRLVEAYPKHKNSIPIENLLLLNPAGELEGEIQSKTTFVHKLFENNTAKEDILHFFSRLHKISLKTPDLIRNYLELSDESGKSITAILQEKSLVGKYLNLFSDIKRSYPALYPAQRNNNAIVIDTHTGSVHGSVDKSIVNLVKEYYPDAITNIDNDRVVSINRNQDWQKKIGDNISELDQSLTDLTTSKMAIEELVEATMAVGEDKEGLCNKFKFQAEAALRMVKGLQSGRYGSTFIVDANQVVTCGLIPREIVAIAYSSLKNRELWNHPEKHDQQFMYFIENLYIAKRGYNIDRNGEDEWRSNPTEEDNNKCTGGTINQVIYGLSDNKLVSIEVKTSDTMLPILSKKLQDPILKDIHENEGQKNLIITWLNGGLLNNGLMDEILKKLKNDEVFKKEFSESEINNLAPQVLNKLNGSQLSEIKNSLSEILANEIDKNFFDPSKVNTFAFDENEGYILALENLYNINKELFSETLKRELVSSINRTGLNSTDAIKTNCIINLLLSSQNEEMTNAAQEIFKEHIQSFNQAQKDLYLILMAEANNGYMLTPLLESGSDINARDNRAGHAGRNALIYAAQNNNIKAMELLINAEADINSKDTDEYTALDIALQDNNIDLITTLFNLGADINIQDNQGRTALHFAALINSIDSIKVLINLGADINAKNNKGRTALHVAALHLPIFYYKIDLIKVLINLGADINIQDNQGGTALHIAAVSNLTDVIKALIRAGADINIKNNNGETAFDLATDYVKEILKDYLALPDCKNQIIDSLNTTLPNDNLSVTMAELPKDILSELAEQLEPEIMKLASSNLGFNIGKIISYFPENLRRAYFQDVVIESMKKMDQIKIQKMLQPFNGEEKIFFYNELNEYKKKASQTENTCLDDINFSIISTDINNPKATTAIRMPEEPKSTEVNITEQALQDLSTENKKTNRKIPCQALGKNKVFEPRDLYSSSISI